MTQNNLLSSVRLFLSVFHVCLVKQQRFCQISVSLMLFLQIQTHELIVFLIFLQMEKHRDAALEMMNMSPAILNYTVKFNQTVAAVQYNDTNSSFSSLHCVFISRSLRFFTPESPRLL